jgi:uncharacterized damage-inducible protein DinB
MTPSYIKLFAHVAWADGRTLGALRTAPNVDANAVKLMAHILGSQQVWLSRIERSTPGPIWPDLDLDGCERLATDVHERYGKFVSLLNAETLQRVISYRNSAGDAFESTIEDILSHVMLHCAYHRGQIAALIRGSGAAPNPTDYIAFTRGAPTATRSA